MTETRNMGGPDAMYDANALESLLPTENALQNYDSPEYQQCKSQISHSQSQVLRQIYQQAVQGYVRGSPEEVAKLHDALQQLGPVSEKHGIIGSAGMTDLIQQHKDVQQQIADAKQRAAKLEVVADLEKRQARFEACLSADKFQQAADCLQSLLEFSQSQQGSAFPDFQQQCLNQKSALQANTVVETSFEGYPALKEQLLQALKDFVANAFAWQMLQDLVNTAVQSEAPHRPQLVINPTWLTGAGTDSQEVWRALQSLGSLQDVIGKLAKQICMHVLRPLLQLHPHPVHFQTQTQQDAEGSYSLEVSYGPAHAQEGQHVCSVESATLQCLQAIKQHAFSNNQEMVHELGSALWPKLAQEYVDCCMKPDQDQLTDAALLRNLLDHFKTAEQFETAAVQLLHQDEGRAGPRSPGAEHGAACIHAFAQHCIDKAMHAKRMEVVEQARDIVVRDTQLETAIVGEDILLTPRSPDAQPDAESDALLAAGPFSVTKSTHKVMQLVGGFLQDAVSSDSAAVVQSMCNAVLDIVLLFTAPSPKARHQLEEVAQLSCLHYNNCNFLAHELVQLPFMLRPPMAAVLGHNWQFLTIADDLRAAGQASLNTQVDRQAREVVGLLNAANGFRQVTSGQKGIAARRVVSQVLHSLSKLGDALGGVLPSQIYVQAAGQVLQALLETVVDDLLLINDISVDESEDLPKILGPLVEEGPLAALGRAHQQPNAAFSPATNKRQLLQTMKLAAPAIVKLQELLELMDVRLVEIQDRWQSGRLQTCGFEGQEVVHLVRALFEDTEGRRRVLHIVAST
ncbi:TPA: hypothetical protein ACH3X1_010090 [Trebouxia sp. C0004]